MERIKNAGIPILSMILVCLFPCAFLFFQNADEARWGDMLPFLGVFLLTAAAIFLISLLFLKNMGRSALLTDAAMVVGINFTMVCDGIKKVLPGFQNKILLILAILVLAAIFVLFIRKKPNVVTVCGLVALMFGAMTLVNGFMAMPTLISQATYEKEGGSPDFVRQTFTGEKRNVYYLVFDEYGGPESLQRYFDYDNEEFLGELEDRGFFVSRNSRNTESPWTVTLLPNLLNLDYVVSDAIPVNNRYEWLEKPALFELFWNNGYEVQVVNHNGYLNDSGCRVLTKNQREETISRYLYQNSIFCQIPGLKKVVERYVLGWSETPDMDALTNAVEAMKTCADHVGETPTLTVCYVVAPHTPFLFDGEGNLQPRSEYMNWTRPELFMAKLHYINGHILETIDNIQKNDPEAVILIQGDHGARVPGHYVSEYGGPWFDTELEIPYMANVMNCVYIPDRTLDISGDTGINATRKTIDAVFGTDLGTIPVPELYEIPKEYMPPPPEK